MLLLLYAVTLALSTLSIARGFSWRKNVISGKMSRAFIFFICKSIVICFIALELDDDKCRSVRHAL